MWVLMAGKSVFEMMSGCLIKAAQVSREKGTGALSLILGLYFSYAAAL